MNMQLKFTMLSSIILAMSSQPAFADEAAYQLQQKMLFEPSSHMLQSEVQNNRVFIYEGMKLADVDKAMDEQFDRVDNMMFIKTRVINPETGHEEIDDSDCDF